MAETLCPVCGKPNPEGQEICQFCGWRLIAAPEPTPPERNPGKETGKKEVSASEKESPGETIRPGEAPTRKSTASLEQALPSWLRSVRQGKDAQPDEPADKVPPEQSLPLGSARAANAEPAPEPDWLSGLGQVGASDDEEVPDWLADLKTKKTEPAIPPTKAAPGSASATPLPGPEPAGEPASGTIGASPQEEQPSWLTPITPAAAAETPSQSGAGERPDWFDTSKPVPVSSQGNDETPAWLDTLSTTPAESSTPAKPQDQGDAAPDWLSALSTLPQETTPVESSSQQAVPAENLPDWLTLLRDKASDQDATQGGFDNAQAETEPAPDWLSNMGAAGLATSAAAGEALPDWLSNLEAQTGPSAGNRLALKKDLPSANAGSGDIPDWLSNFQADINANAEKESRRERFEEAPPLPAAKKEENASLPDWLAGIKQDMTSSADTPALIGSDENKSSGGESDTAFSLEMPDWLARLSPEEAAEKASAVGAEAPASVSPDVSELPSWVQAMRPVESVVGDTRSIASESSGIAEQSGPLAGLSGVLPVGPGLGQLRIPPAYSVKLQASDGQQRYAAALERLITSETEPQVIKASHIPTNRLWRWLISILLIVAVSLPLVTNLQITKATTLRPPEMLSAFKVISGLAPQAPVLLVFDYEPAFSGELEAAASPLVDHLLYGSPRLAVISTSPTGPILAERFLHDASASPQVTSHNYEAGVDYVNLGYLAGGPSGVQYFASSPSKAARFTIDGNQAWGLLPLAGVQSLSDFKAIIILTDNADSGRVWVEQAGAALGSTPLLMVISAQAEPMLLPYYDSGQVQGLVTGLAGGEAYAQTVASPGGKTSLVQRYWDSFSAGTLVAILLIVVGGAWNTFSGWRARSKKSGEEA